jgi:hypothetical protein
VLAINADLSKTSSSGGSEAVMAQDGVDSILPMAALGIDCSFTEVEPLPLKDPDEDRAFSPDHHVSHAEELRDSRRIHFFLSSFGVGATLSHLLLRFPDELMQISCLVGAFSQSENVLEIRF